MAEGAVVEMIKRTKLLVKKLHAKEVAAREEAAEQLAYLLEADVLRGPVFTRTVKTLLASALSETDPTARESMFNALSSAPSGLDFSTVDWDPLAAVLDNLETDCLEHALVILGATGDTRYRGRIEKVRHHRDATIRLTAAEALEELDAVRRQNLVTGNS